MSTKNSKSASKAKSRSKAPAAEAARPNPGPGQPRKPIPVATIDAFATGIAQVCDMFGVAPGDLIGRNVAEGDRALAASTLRKLTLGAVASLGRDLGLSWHSMLLADMPKAIHGAHKTTLASFSAQFNAWTGLALDAKGKAGHPSGEVARFARDRYLQIKRDVLALAAGKAAA